MNKLKLLRNGVATLFATFLLYSSPMLIIGQAQAGDVVDANIKQLQHDWARTYYQVPEKQKKAEFKALAEKAKKIRLADPEQAKYMVWEGIILSSYAKFAGGLNALSKAKAARELLLAAEKIEPDVLNGSIYVSLGSLYYKVPGWPIGFGSNRKALEYLQKAIEINPDGIDPNYFMGDFLLERGEYEKARGYLVKALAAPLRPGREDADLGRRGEIQQALQKINQH